MITSEKTYTLDYFLNETSDAEELDKTFRRDSRREIIKIDIQFFYNICLLFYSAIVLDPTIYVATNSTMTVNEENGHERKRS
jgi:hypothetical protein